MLHKFTSTTPFLYSPLRISSRLRLLSSSLLFLPLSLSVHIYFIIPPFLCFPYFILFYFLFKCLSIEFSPSPLLSVHIRPLLLVVVTTIPFLRFIPRLSTPPRLLIKSLLLISCLACRKIRPSENAPPTLTQNRLPLLFLSSRC